MINGRCCTGRRDAARNFADLFGDVAAYVRYRDAADQLRKAADTHLYSTELGRFARRIAIEEDGTETVDLILDSAIYGLWRFGMYQPTDQRITDTMTAIRDQLSNKANSGGIARYENDYYFKVEPDTKLVPGNPGELSVWVDDARVKIEGVVLPHRLRPTAPAG